ncbi:CPBP family intramembrane glutamic endopeptidase [Serratia sp. CY56810]|uniref:CPBP family intramembrane glutamic endopeptidase n=1 Tax=Serratia sp. CY56810 TaxID=3383642 RepID=UPI003F9F9FD5
MISLINKFSILLYGVASIALFKFFQDSILLNLWLLKTLHLTFLELSITKTVIGIVFSISLVNVLNNSLQGNKISPGTINLRSTWFALAILVSYTAAYYLTPDEPYMQNFLKGLSSQEIAVRIISTIILTPILEELIFRGIFLSSFLNLLGDRLGYIAGGVIVSTVFAWMHSQYSIQTQILMFTVSIIFCAARYYSKGLALPIALHALCVIIGIASEYI